MELIIKPFVVVVLIWSVDIQRLDVGISVGPERCKFHSISSVVYEYSVQDGLGGCQGVFMSYFEQVYYMLV